MIKKVQQITLILFFLFNGLTAQPLIRSILNDSPILFSIKEHNDMSECSLFNSGQEIKVLPYSRYSTEMLLASSKPGLVLTPVAYWSKKTGEKYYFINDQGVIDDSLLEIAFAAWKKDCFVKYKKSAQQWFHDWIGGNIVLIHNDLEVFGYVLNISFAKIKNNKKSDSEILSYSKGVFSRLIIDLFINHDVKKGIALGITSSVGQGAICKDKKTLML